MPKPSLGKATLWQSGRVHYLDKLEAGAPEVGNAISLYGNAIATNRQSRQWVRAVQWIENILFSMGRHYVDDMLVSRLSSNSQGDQSIMQDVTRSIPRPVNDLIGRFVETNIALLTENRPRPRVTAKSDLTEDQDAAELSELCLEYLWEAHNMPEVHRELARIILHCGVGWLEVAWDDTAPRRLSTTQTEKQNISYIEGPPGTPPVALPLQHRTGVLDPFGAQAGGKRPGRDKKPEDVEYGDINVRVVSPFEMYLPIVHWWNGDDMGWVMREWYTPKDTLVDRYTLGKVGKRLTTTEGWHLDRLDDVGTDNVQNLPIWWWERLSDLVEGPGPSLYVGSPEQWEGYTVCRIFDRAPSPLWPNGRTIITAGTQVLYDSPRDKGARAFDPRWPSRWHPYVRYRWEGQIGSIYGRSLVSKLLPKLKRINAIDTALIMWRRTVPIATWIIPKGAHPVEDNFSGRPGQVWEYDPRRTAGAAPQPISPPPFPEAALREREIQLAEMESIAGTEQLLRGQRPTGVNSAAMLDVLRKQALASRSAILQSWDESLQECGTLFLEETIKHVKNDVRYAERIKILAREKTSRLTIDTFSGEDLSDNVIVRVDTASLALVSKEAREAKVLEFLQYAPSLMGLPLQLRQSIVEELGFKKTLTPQGPDVERAKRILSWIRTGNFERVIPMPEDDPQVFFEILSNETKTDQFWDLNPDQQKLLLFMVDVYRQQIQMKQQQMMQMQMMMQGAGMKGGPPSGAGGQGGGSPPTNPNTGGLSHLNDGGDEGGA